MNSMTDITGEDFFEGRTENPSDVCPDCEENPCICLKAKINYDEDDDEFIQNLMDRDNE